MCELSSIILLKLIVINVIPFILGNPHIPPSMIVAKIRERFQENEHSRFINDFNMNRPSSAPPITSTITTSLSSLTITTDDGNFNQEDHTRFNFN